MQVINYILIFAFCVLIFQICSKITIELENTGETSSPIYLASLMGIFSSLYTGAESLYRIAKIKEKEASKIGRKSNRYYIKSGHDV